MGEHRAPAPLPQNGTSPVRSRHAAAVVHGEAGLLAVALPFLDAGLRAGDLVALACPPDVAELLCGELGERAREVRHDLRLTLMGARAPDALAHARRTAERAGDGVRLRILTLVDFGPAASGWRGG